MFKQLQIRTLMGSTIAILLVLLVAAGGSGIALSRYAVQGLQANLDDVGDQVVMGEIRQRMEANRSQVLQALQHNPDTRYATMHDHPLANHFNAVKKNTAEIKQLWSRYEASIAADDERRLAQTWFDTSGQLGTSSVGDAAQAIEAQDWDGAQGILIKTINPLYRKADAAASDLHALLSKRSKASIETVHGDIDSATTLVLVLLAFGLVAGVAAGVFMTRSIARPLAQALDMARSVAQGDLRTVIETDSNNEFGQLLAALKQMNGNLIDIVRDVHAGTDTISTSSSQVAAGSMDLSVRTEQQAGVLEETAAAMEELTSTVKQNGETARHATSLAQSASDVAAAGGRTVNQMVLTMGEIHASARRIADITTVIDGIAFQTNILALNAAVEAARAGEQGRGFAVVANEVRTLAQRAGSASKEIKELIAASTEKVEAGNRMATEAGKTMEDVLSSVNQVAGLIKEIGVASLEQEQGIEQVNVAISEMDSTTQSNARLVEEATEASGALHAQAELLSDKVSVFQLPEVSVPVRGAKLVAQPRSRVPAHQLQLAA